MKDTSYKQHFKDCSPLETINRLKTTLKNMNIDVEEVHSLQSAIGTYSLRVIFSGTNDGTNGKGVSKEYATASAYAELFERLQNDLVLKYNPTKRSKFAFYKASDEQVRSASEIVSDDNAFTNFYFKYRGLENSSFEDKVKAFYSVQRLDMWLYKIQDGFVTLPFYDVVADKVVYLPYHAYTNFYGSNGMAAGNTSEEALVQGLSEIYERVAQKRILLEQPTLPDIPDDYVMSYPYIYKMLTNLRKNDKYECKLIDCSFGGKYPVAGLLIVEKNTGHYGIKLGCHPNYAIAMERAFTEAAQGMDIYEYINRSIVDFHNKNISDGDNITNSYKTGNAQFPYQILGKKPTYSFVRAKDVSGYSNRDILLDWIQRIKDDGNDILIRDVSCLGFPSYHIIIPGVSELQEADDRRFRAINTGLFVRALMVNPDEINEDNIKYVEACLKYFSHSLIENDITQYFPANPSFDFPGNECGCGSLYLLAMCSVYKGDYFQAESILSRMMKYMASSDITQEKADYYRCVYYYVSAMSVMKSHSEAMEYMNSMFSATVCERINNTFEDRHKVLILQYPCSMIPDDKNHPLNIAFSIREKILEKQVECNIQQEELREIFN